MKQLQNFLFIVLVVFLVLQGRLVQAEGLPFPQGESFHFKIKKMIKVGDVDLVFKGRIQVEGKDVYLLSFMADGFNFEDQDDIYLDPDTFLPVQVVRDLNVFGSKEKIVETYDQDQGSVVITKTTKDGVETQTIQKDNVIENIYGFIYRYRLKDRFVQGEAVELTLPTKDIVMKYQGSVDFKYGGERIQAHYFESDPEQFRIWFSPKNFFSKDSGFIPLRIDGAVGFGSTSMILDAD